MSKKAKADSVPALETDTKAVINEWQQLTEWLEQAKTREMELRKQLVAHFFPVEPDEGVNRLITADGFEIVLDHKINRSLDEAALDAVMTELPEESPFRQLGVLIEYKPKLILKGYRSMPENERLIFCQAMTERIGAPVLKINQVTEAMDPATAENKPDWPATNSPAPAKKKTTRKTPAKKATTKKSTAKKAAKK